MADTAIAILEVKAFDPMRRTFSGIASTPELDRQGHIVDPAGVTFRNPVPLLFHHNREAPIGTAVLDPPTEDGVSFQGTIPIVNTPGRLKDRVDEAWQSIEAGLIRGVSIGFRVLKDGIKELKGGRLKLTNTEILELSLVTIPANVSASILTIKSAAMGQNTAGDTAPPVVYVTTPKATTMTTREQISSYEASRSAKAARMQAIMTSAGETGATLDAQQTQEYDDLDREVKALDDHLARARRLEALHLVQATPVPATTPPERASDLRGGPPVVQVVKTQLPPATAFVRMCMAVARSRGDRMTAIEIAKQWKDSTPEVELYLKAAVAPGTTTDPAWAGPLVTIQNLPGEFVDLLRPATIIGKIPGLRMVPFNVQVPVQTAGGSYGWVGQGAPKPVTKIQFAPVRLDITKAAAIIVITEELSRLSTPSAEATVRNDMIRGIAQFLDNQFINPAVAPVAGVNPGSITNGTTAIVSTNNPKQDVAALVSAFANANVPIAGSVLIMSESNAFNLSLVRDYAGLVFPNVGIDGGSIFGMKVITSSQAGNNVILAQPSLILMADDGGVTIDVSREASIQMVDTPDNPALATTILTSLWQDNLIGLRAERYINWQRSLLVAVKYVSGATYVPTLAEFAGEAPPPTGNHTTKAARGQA